MNIEIFKNPGAAYRGKPFWSWNGKLEEEELKRQANLFKEMGFGGYFMHSRTGLATEYLGEEWFRLINAVADESEKLGMEAWLYDEDRWPSGSAGGKVTVDESLRQQSLVLHEAPAHRFTYTDEVVLAYEADLAEDGLTLHSYRPLKKGEIPDAGKKAVWFTIEKDKPNSNYNGTTYIDTMKEKATRRFLELTHDEYLRHCGSRIGTVIPGIFSDEPSRGACMGDLSEENGVRTDRIFYTDDIFQEFEKRYGYDLRPRMIEVFYRLGGEKVSKPRMDYMDLGCDLFCERFASPIQQWCREHGLRFTGHVLHEDLLCCQAAPNGSLLRFYQNMDAPGIDTLSSEHSLYWVAVQCRSVCRQLGKKQMLSELYGASGWEFNLRGHKRLGAWQALFGVNLRCPHLSWYTMEGQGKRDYPGSISWHSAYWKYYDHVESFFARMGYLLSLGKPECDLLVIHPIESIWALEHLGWARWIFSEDADVQTLEQIYEDTFRKLAGSRIDFDYGEEQMLSKLGKVGTDEEGPYLQLGESIYRKVLVTGLLTLRESTFSLLCQFAASGGTLVFAGPAPTYVDGQPSDLCSSLPDALYTPELDLDLLRKDSRIRFHAPETVFAQIRRDQEQTILVLMNTDDENAADFELSADGSEDTRLLFLDLETGERYRYPSSCTDTGLQAHIHLEAAETAAWMLTQSAEELPLYDRSQPKVSGVLTKGAYTYRLEEPNVCVLDGCRLRWNQEPQAKPLMEVLKADQLLRDQLGLERRGGEMLQPWYAKDRFQKILGELTLEYPFRIETIPVQGITLAAERPDEWDYYINGEKLEPDGKFWYDNAFKTLPISADQLKKGANVITARCHFRQTTNLEALYLFGDFGVKAKMGDSTLTTAASSLPLINMERELPFYGGSIALTIPYERYQNYLRKDAPRILVRISHFTGSLVTVNEKPILWEPYTADITEAVKKKQALEITLVCSRRNMMGPLHLLPKLQPAYGPEAYVSQGDAWSDDYALLPTSLGEIEFLS